MTNNMLIDKTVEIVKEAARGGTGVSLDVLLDRVYEKLRELDSKE